MPGLQTHCVQAALGSAAVFPFTGFEYAAVFGLSTVLIDVDHVIEYVRQTGSPKLWGVFPCCQIIQNNLHRGFYVFNLFHTAEILLLTGLLGLVHPVFFYVFAGVLWHCALDLFELARKNAPFIRALSIIEYCIRARKPGTLVRVHDLLRINALSIPKDRWNYPAWIRHWQHCRTLC
jgi:hypothetical protein